MTRAALNDTIRLMHRMSWKKLVNGVQLLTSYFWSKFRGRVFHSGLPLSLSIEPTTACNLRCPECPSGLRSFTRPTGKMTLSMFRGIIDNVKDHLLYLNFYFQGEPYLHPHFLEMVRYASAKGIYTATSTNAHFLSDEAARKTIESGLDRLIISIDGVTQETYEAYRKEGKLDEVLKGTRRIVEWRTKLRSRTPHIIFQFLVVRQNEHEIEHVKKMAKSVGVDELKLKTAQINDFETGSELIPSDKYSRYRKTIDGSWALKNDLLNECWKMWHSPVITWDGKVVPCCFDKDAHHAMGNVQESSFKEIWRGRSYQQFRSALISSRKDIDICKNCSEGGPVWV